MNKLWFRVVKVPLAAFAAAVAAVFVWEAVVYLNANKYVAIWMTTALAMTVFAVVFFEMFE